MVKGVTSSGVNYQYQPIILIVAPRSGTKLVRDLVAEHPDVDRVPYDIDYVWRLGNEAVPHEELSVDLLTPQIRQRILRRFESRRDLLHTIEDRHHPFPYGVRHPPKHNIRDVPPHMC